MSAFVRVIAAVVALVALSIGAHALSDHDHVFVRWVTPDGKVMKQTRLDRADIEALPQGEVETQLRWMEGVHHFTGPSIGAIADLGPQPVQSAKIVALNDYVATLPREDWADLGAILATKHNGDHMLIRDKGPFWVVYPVDDRPEILDRQIYHDRMVWQVETIDFFVE